MLKRIALVAALSLASVAPVRAQLAPGSDLVDNVIAIVGDSMLLRSQIVETIVRLQLSDPNIPRDTDPDFPDFFDQVLNSAVDQLLVIQAAARDSTLQPDEAQVDQQVNQRIEELRNQVGGMPALQVALQRDGWTLAEYREFLRQDARQLQILQLFFQSRLRDARPVEVTEQELRERFEEASANLQQQRPRLLTFRQVVIRPAANDSAKAAARQESQAILERLAAGEDFAVVATQTSEDVGTAPVGGDLGWFRRGQMVREFEDAAFSTPVGRVSNIVESPFGYHIIKVERVRGRSEIQARHILTIPEVNPADVERARLFADSIALRAQAGESMTSLYDEYSDPLAPDSLTIAFQQLDQLPPGYNTALSGVSGGEIVGPFQYQAGTSPGDVRFAIVKVLQVREAGAYTFEDLRPQLATQLDQEKKRERILEDLRAQTYIEIRR